MSSVRILIEIAFVVPFCISMFIYFFIKNGFLSVTLCRERRSWLWNWFSLNNYTFMLFMQAIFELIVMVYCSYFCCPIIFELKIERIRHKRAACQFIHCLYLVLCRFAIQYVFIKRISRHRCYKRNTPSWSLVQSYCVTDDLDTSNIINKKAGTSA